MAEVTEEQIVQYAESVGYRRVSRREFELVAGDAAPHGTRVPLGVMTRRAQEYFDAIDDELGTVHEPEETTAVQLQRFVDELRDVPAFGKNFERTTAVVAAVAQGLVSHQGLILKEKDTAQ